MCVFLMLALDSDSDWLLSFVLIVVACIFIVCFIILAVRVRALHISCLSCAPCILLCQLAA